MQNLLSIVRAAALMAALTLVFSTAALAQTSNASPTTGQNSSDTKAETIINSAIAAVGGDAYLNVRTVVGRGFYTTYQDGVSLVPTRFLDYIVFPDKERTEFTTQGIRVINTNNGETGWLYDGATKSVNDLKPVQIEDFKRAMRTSVENLLRGWWRKENATLAYVGRREAGLAKRNETVRLTYPDGFWVEFEFGAKDALPAKVIYKRTRTKADSDETEEITEEDWLAKPITNVGITAPFVIDHYLDGKQSSRINYESIEYNRSLPDTLFAKPANAKSVK
ncbi:MAG TPA: hypothetical protein VFH15_12695 [Pyrinomonadaceae bacterium]|nr:hypothetical protein [Pyrinomonadaceae bacterium]